MTSPGESRPAAACPAEATLTDDEARDLNVLPGADFETVTRSLGCVLLPHDAGGRHAVCVQTHYIGKTLILWSLLCHDDGYRELRVAPGRPRSTVAESCLLIWYHPGECDPSCGSTREEPRAVLDSARKEGKA
ncbi:hypothetical protein [Streptomyces sp. NPDC046985]|uniref:hypothetical protein n=1 Tax=Streptomyces sp. NPDC046985 TaxID=3155377 RepID=UPI0033C7A875